MFCVVTNAPFIGRVEQGVETSVYITELAVIRILEAFLSKECKIQKKLSITSSISWVCLVDLAQSGWTRS